MRWEGGEQSDNVEDRRGMKGGVAAGGGIGALVLAAVVYFLTGDARVAQQAGQIAANRQAAPEQRAEPINDRTSKFVGTVLRFTEVVWDEQFKKAGERYEKPHLVLFTEAVATKGCGNAPSSVGPFYCPADKTVYLDPSFFDELEGKLGGSKAEFSQAYVIAHEVGHHVQNLLGYNRKLKQFEGREGANAGVRLELQADYLAGVWAHHGQQKFRFIEPGDVESAVTTAKAIGDDRLQKKSRGWVSPESFTHGSAEARVRAFRAGFETGDLNRLDRFFTAPLGELDPALGSAGRR